MRTPVFVSVALAFVLLASEGFGLPSPLACGAVPASEYFKTDPPSLRSQVVKTSVPFPRWKSAPKIFVSSALGPAAEPSELLEIFHLAGRDLDFVRDIRTADFTILAFSGSGRKTSPGVVCGPCNAPHAEKSEFDIFGGHSPLVSRSLDLLYDAPEGQGTSERYWPSDQMDFVWDDRQKISIGNVSGLIAVDRRMQITAAECWINVDLPLAVQTSAISECAVRALGFPGVGSTATLRVWSQDERKLSPAAKIDDQTRSCITEFYS